jgi:hypothetical protein
MSSGDSTYPFQTRAALATVAPSSTRWSQANEMLSTVVGMTVSSLAGGRWQCVASGKWQVASGDWQLAIGN